MGLWIVRLADEAGWVRPTGVEVAQCNMFEPVRQAGPVHQTLHGQFCLAVAVRWCRAVGFQYWYTLRLAIGRCGRREHNVFNIID